MTKKERIKRLEEDIKDIREVLDDCDTNIYLLRRQLACSHTELEYIRRGGKWMLSYYYIKKCSICGLEIAISSDEYEKHMKEEWCKKPTNKTKRKKK